MYDPNKNNQEKTEERDEMSAEVQLWRWGGEDEEGSMAYRNKHNPPFPHTEMEEENGDD
jgi:hypothetical protein